MKNVDFIFSVERISEPGTMLAVTSSLATRSSETSVLTRPTRLHILEDGILHSLQCKSGVEWIYRRYWLGGIWHMVLLQDVSGCVVLAQDPIVPPWRTAPHWRASACSNSTLSTEPTPMHRNLPSLAVTGSGYILTGKYRKLYDPPFACIFHKLR
jgi:hypothetical protein